MRRLKFPVVMPYRPGDWVVTFEAMRVSLSPLGEPGFIEDDPYRTAGPRELFWAFETDDGLRLHICWDEGIQEATVLADPPDGNAVVEVLRSLGLQVPLRVRPPSEVPELARFNARGAVWLFSDTLRAEPIAVFSRKQLADEWIAQARVTGVLSPLILDASVRDVVNGRVREAEERYEYIDGVQVP